MNSRILSQPASVGSEKIHVLIFDTGDEVKECLLHFAREKKINSAHFTAIGAFSNAILGYFDWEKKNYLKIPVNEQVECVSLIGDIALGKDGPQIHAHLVIGKRDGSVMGGHLLEAHVRPTLELVLSEAPAHLHRVVDAQTGLALIDVGTPAGSA